MPNMPPQCPLGILSGSSEPGWRDAPQGAEKHLFKGGMGRYRTGRNRLVMKLKSPGIFPYFSSVPLRLIQLL